MACLIDGSDYFFTGDVLAIKNKIVKANLPSLGFTLVAKIETGDSLQSNVTFSEKNLLLQS